MIAIARRGLVGLPLALAGCGLATRPYLARTQWPFDLPEPPPLPPRPGGPVLLVRDLGAGPGLDQRGLQVIGRAGRLHVSFYQQWAVPPAEGLTAALRRRLAGSGLFGAVIGPGSVLLPGYVLEGELDALAAEVAAGVAEARAGFRFIARRGGAERLVFAAAERAAAPLPAPPAPLTGAAIVAAERAALAHVLDRLTARIAAALA
ncbi:MAG: ABC-type transport auxiliary lipoprotein family protein [Acetobacteraceae bacterium]